MDQKRLEPLFKVTIGKKLLAEMRNFPKQDVDFIFDFINAVQQGGFSTLKGRNKSSSDVPKNDPNWLSKVRYAQEHNLWHYHIGIPSYRLSTNGDYVSKYVLHYVMNGDEIRIVAYDEHPPFRLPNLSYIID